MNNGFDREDKFYEAMADQICKENPQRVNGAKNMIFLFTQKKLNDGDIKKEVKEMLKEKFGRGK